MKKFFKKSSDKKGDGDNPIAKLHGATSSTSANDNTKDDNPDVLSISAALEDDAKPASILGQDPLEIDEQPALAPTPKKPATTISSSPTTNQSPASANPNAPAIGQYIKGKGVYVGQWVPLDVKAQVRPFFRIYDVYAAPGDLRNSKRERLLLPFKKAVSHVAKLKNWHGHDGAKMLYKSDITDAILKQDESRLGKWFIPPYEVLMANLFANKDQGVLKGTFEDKHQSNDDYKKAEKYWSSTRFVHQPLQKQLLCVNFASPGKFAGASQEECAQIEKQVSTMHTPAEWRRFNNFSVRPIRIEPADRPDQKGVPLLHKIGERVPGKGIYAGTWKPRDWDKGTELDKVFDIYAAPEDLPQGRKKKPYLKYTEASGEIGALKNWHGHNGVNIQESANILNFINNGDHRELEQWFIPTFDMLQNNLFPHRFTGEFNGTFATQKPLTHAFKTGIEQRCSYWSNFNFTVPTDVRKGMDFDNGMNAGGAGAFKLLTRPVRAELRL